MTRLVDSHCHLQDKAFDPDREAVIERALSSLSWLVVIGDSLESSDSGLRLVRPGVYCAVGIHPYHPEQADTAGLARLHSLATQPGVVGIGEIGLDYYKYNDAPRDLQIASFRAQLRLASELNLPVVIHNREAQEDIATILAEYSRDIPGGIMHCFSSDAPFAERCLELGFYISFAGNVSYPKATALRDSALSVPLNRILVETDSPYLAPQNVRGRRCEPAFVEFTAAALADIRSLTMEQVAEATTENAHAVFRVPRD